MKRFEGLFLSGHEIHRAQKELPRQQSEVVERPRREPSEYISKFLERLPGGRRIWGIGIALGVGIFPLGREIFYRSIIEKAHAAEVVPDREKEIKDVQEFMESLDGHDIQYEVSKGVVIAHVDGAGLDGGAYETFEVPALSKTVEIDTNFLWGGKDYSQTEAMPGEIEQLQDQTRVLMQDIEDQDSVLGIDTASSVGRLNVWIDAHASREGTELNNQALTQERAEKARQAISDVVVVEEGLSESSVRFLSVEGQGEEGDLSEFVSAMEAKGVDVEAKNATTEQVAESIIRGIHDHEIDDQRVIDAYNETVVPHRHVHVTMQFERDKVVFMVGKDASFDGKSVPSAEQMQGWMIAFTQTETGNPFSIATGEHSYDGLVIPGGTEKQILESSKIEWGIVDDHPVEIPRDVEHAQPPVEVMDPMISTVEPPPLPPHTWPPRPEKPRVHNKQLAIFAERYANARHARAQQTATGVGSVVSSKSIGRAPSLSGTFRGKEIQRKDHGRDHHSGRRTNNKKK